jgi:hypothetical protein
VARISADLNPFSALVRAAIMKKIDNVFSG